MSNLRIFNDLGDVRALTANKLAGVGDVLPAVKQRLPFPEYVAKAEARSLTDPVFREQYQTAKAQYEALGGKIHAE